LVFKTGQPALLYISPALIITVVAVAVKRGHLRDMKFGIDVDIELQAEREKFKYNVRSTEE
jgi:hypothetical protein